MFVNGFKKIPKVFWICMAIILACCLIFRNKLQQAEEHTNHVKELYQAKNDFAFVTFLKDTQSFIPLAATLESLSTVSDNDPQEIVRLINKAKVQSEDWEERVRLLIEFCDDYTNHADPRLMLNNSVMTSQQQEEAFTLTFQASIWRVVYNVSFWYSKSKPKVIDGKTRDTFKSIATEVRKLDQTIINLKESAAPGQFREGYEEYLKKRLLDQMTPHLERLYHMQDEFIADKIDEMKHK